MKKVVSDISYDRYRLPSRCCSFPSLVRGTSRAFKSSLTRLGSVGSASSLISALSLTNLIMMNFVVNLKLLITNMEAHVRAFEAKLMLWGKQLYKRDYVHFPHLGLCDVVLVDTEECVSVLSTLRNEFSSRASLMCVLIRKSSRSSALLLTFPMATPPLMCNWS